MAKKESWEIVLTKPAEKVYRISSKDKLRRVDKCFEILEKNPHYGNNIKPLTGQLRGLLRFRVGDWRVIYRLWQQTNVVEIIAILPRSNAHK